MPQQWISRRSTHFDRIWSEKMETILSAIRPSMTQAWTILVVWLALQIPLGMLAGKAIKYGMLVPAAGSMPPERIESWTA
jgi:hypothetical protein